MPLRPCPVANQSPRVSGGAYDRATVGSHGPQTRPGARRPHRRERGQEARVRRSRSRRSPPPSPGRRTPHAPWCFPSAPRHRVPARSCGRSRGSPGAYAGPGGGGIWPRTGSIGSGRGVPRFGGPGARCDHDMLSVQCAVRECDARRPATGDHDANDPLRQHRDPQTRASTRRRR